MCRPVRLICTRRCPTCSCASSLAKSTFVTATPARAVVWAIQATGLCAPECKACSAKCPPGEGVQSKCDRFQDLQCQRCTSTQYISDITGRCSDCDKDQVYHKGLNNACGSSATLLTTAATSARMGRFLEFLPHRDKCRACRINTRRVLNKCEPCTASEFTPAPGATFCTQCPLSHHRPAGETGCVECLKAHIARTRTRRARRVAYHIRTFGMPECQRCQVGFTNNADHSSCSPC